MKSAFDMLIEAGQRALTVAVRGNRLEVNQTGAGEIAEAHTRPSASLGSFQKKGIF